MDLERDNQVYFVIRIDLYVSRGHKVLLVLLIWTQLPQVESAVPPIRLWHDLCKRPFEVTARIPMINIRFPVLKGLLKNEFWSIMSQLKNLLP